MSPYPPPNQGPSRPESGWVTGLLAVLGVILLLPGVCAIFFAVTFEFDRTFLGLWAVCLLISAVGVITLYLTFRKPRQPPGPA